jgi:hypothetical protein
MVVLHVVANLAYNPSIFNDHIVILTATAAFMAVH